MIDTLRSIVRKKTEIYKNIPETRIKKVIKYANLNELFPLDESMQFSQLNSD